MNKYCRDRGYDLSVVLHPFVNQTFNKSKIELQELNDDILKLIRLFTKFNVVLKGYQYEI